METRPSIYNIVYLGPMKENRYLVGPRGLMPISALYMRF